MSLTYVATFTGVSISAQQDLFSILAPAVVPIKIMWIRLSCLSQSTASEVSLNLLRISAPTQGSGGTVITPVEKGQVSGRVSTATVHANDTVLATGTLGLLWADTMQVLNGWDYLPIPELWDQIPASDIFSLRLVAAASVVMSGSIAWSESV